MQHRFVVFMFTLVPSISIDWQFEMIGTLGDRDRLKVDLVSIFNFPGPHIRARYPALVRRGPRRAKPLLQSQFNGSCHISLFVVGLVLYKHSFGPNT